MRLVLHWLPKLSETRYDSKTNMELHVKLGEHEILNQEQLDILKKTLMSLTSGKVDKVLRSIRNLLNGQTAKMALNLNAGLCLPSPALCPLERHSKNRIVVMAFPGHLMAVMYGHRWA